MAGAHPYLGLTACVVYLFVSAACALAARHSRTSQSRFFWIFVAIFFSALAVVRGTGIEAYVTDGLRHWLYAEGAYEDRRDIQRPLAAGAVVGISGILFLLYLKRPSPRAGLREWSKFWGVVGTIMMCGVIAMRLISFHDLDRLLYGPVRMNWILDIGSSAIVTWAALRFRKAINSGEESRPPRPVNRSGRH